MLEIIPFRSGRRPIDERVKPGLGCSEHVGFIDSQESTDAAIDDLWILFRLHALPDEALSALSVRLSAFWLGEADDTEAVAGLTERAVAPQILAADSATAPHLLPAGFACGRTFVATIPLQSTLSERARYDFAQCFFRRVRVELTLHRNGQPLCRATAEVEVFDLSRLGSLYDRLREQLLPADTAAQARAADLALRPQHHPFFPVLEIGTEKAGLYLAALRQDVAAQRRHLPDARWLLRVGLYLEFLTCIGLCEAVREEHPDLLSATERQQLFTSAALAPVRRRLRIDGWKRVWAHHRIAARQRGLPSAGPVSLLNLLRKQRATLSFLHAHHEDLRSAIELAGPNLRDGQQTWLRVFRDAERAVWRQAPAAFPELEGLPDRLRQIVLWRQAGELLPCQRLLPRSLAALLGDQDGLFPAAALQYRHSMNQVAEWARGRGLMTYSGKECVPESASLLAAYRQRDARQLGRLQHGDGYPSLDLSSPLAGDALPTAA